MKQIIRLSAIGLLFSFSFFHSAQAQGLEVRGTVTDSAGVPLQGITAVMQHLAQEELAVGGITDEKGQFVLSLRAAGQFRLAVYSAGYATYADTLRLTSDKRTYDLGQIRLLAEIRTFEVDDVVIEGEKTPMLIKGDTVEYNADSYVTRPNAVLEKLLEQLPGVEIAEDGSITAEGQPVQRILIDGKEFFGNNVQLAVKNIPVDAVLKVQVTDSKSEETEFTGVDDGQRLKTINLVLKKEKRSGYFGTLAGGYGIPNDRFVGRANAFRFSTRMQLSLLGLTNNVNEVGFGWDQIREFMGGSENMGRTNWNGNNVGIGGVNVGLPTSWGNNDGYITTQAGGINLNYQLNDRTDLTTTYLYGGATTTRREQVYRENFLPDNSFITEDSSLQERRTDGHAFNMRLRHEIDSTQEIEIQTAGSWSQERNDNNAINRAISSEGFEQNRSARLTSRLQTHVEARAAFNYRKRFQKKGRNLYLGVTAGIGDEDTDSDIRSDNRFYDRNTGSFEEENLLQNQLFEGDEWNYNFYSGYNEPLNEHNFLTFGLNRSQNLEDNLRDAFDIDPDNATLRSRNDALSNHFRRTMEQNRISFGYRKDTEHLRIRAQLNGEQTRLNSEYFSADTTLDQRFFFVLPDVDIRYTFDNDLRFEVEYDTYIREPSLYQLQPFVDNTNPLRIYQGNPALRPVYYHQFEIGLNRYDRQTRKGYGVRFDLDLANDAITTRKTVDSLLRQVTQPINVGRALDAGTRLFYRLPFGFLKSRLSVDLSGNYQENTVFLNGVATLVTRYRESLRLGVENRNRNVLGYNLYANWDLNQTQYAEQENFNRNTFNHRYSANLEWVINPMWTIGSRFTYRLYAGDAFNDQQNVPIWNAEIVNYPFKDAQLEIKLSGTDLLNRNIGFRRSATDTYIEEERIESLTQYFLLTATWKLSKMSVGEGRKKFLEKKK